MDKLNPQEYEHRKGEIFFYDHLGRERFKRGAGQQLAIIGKDLINKLKTVLKGKKWLNNLPSVQWILITRNNILRSSSASYIEINEKSKIVCNNHLDLGYRELLELYDSLR